MESQTLKPKEQSVPQYARFSLFLKVISFPGTAKQNNIVKFQYFLSDSFPLNQSSLYKPTHVVTKMHCPIP